MARKPELGNVQLYPRRPLRSSDRNGYVLKFYCPIRGRRIRRNCGTRDGRDARSIQRECRERLLNGEYALSGGAITKKESENKAPLPSAMPLMPQEKTWDEAFELFRNHKKRRLRERSFADSLSRISIAGRIFESRRANSGMVPGVSLRECTTLEAMEFLQDQLLDGEEGRLEERSANTVNSMIVSVMTFIRYCFDHEWIDRLPGIKKLDVDSYMKGRPIVTEEFDRLLKAVPVVVGDGPAESWLWPLRILWESGFRLGDLMDFSWDDEQRLHPVWPRRRGQRPTLAIPSTQKNKRVEEIPMLPGLQVLLESVPMADRTGFVVNPQPIEFDLGSQGEWFMPTVKDLSNLIVEFSNCSIATACGVSEQTVRNWLARLGLVRTDKIKRYGQLVPTERIESLRKNARRRRHQARIDGRFSVDRMSRIICKIGEVAKIIVRPGDEALERKPKYASAHDLRRGLAERLINHGVSAETLMVVMRHKDFATTRKFYGAIRSAQSAAEEIHQKLVECTKSELVGGLVGGHDQRPNLTDNEIKKLKALLNSL